MALKQATRALQISTPLGDDVLVLAGFSGEERVSGLFQFTLDLISDDGAIAAPDIVGKPVSFSVEYGDKKQRYFHGFVRRFIAGKQDDLGRRNYRAEVVPWLWFLSQTCDCRIFQNQTAPDIIKKIFEDLGFTDFRMDVRGSHPKRDYCVQYRETDLVFVERLCEEEGIFWFFQHENGKHTMVLADHAGAYSTCEQSRVDFPRDHGSRALEDHITAWDHSYEFRSGKVTQTDFNFQTPSTSLLTTEKTVVPFANMEAFEIYDYPGIYPDKAAGQPLSRIRMEAEEAATDIVSGASNCASFLPGGSFELREHQSPSERGKKYVLTRVAHQATEPLAYETGAAEGLAYANQFTCIPKTVVYRSPRVTPKPIIQGVQTAIVVGPPGEEIYTDEYGRVKVQFHWDREGKHDDKSSCWIRSSQVHAGNGFGGIDIPRMGEEVVVSFLEGDPDRPLITGRVYHAENMPPFGLPDKKVVSGLKSKTYKGSGYNEFIMDDSPGNELVRTHAQFDQETTVEHDQRTTVNNNRTDKIAVDDSETVGSNQTIQIGADQTTTVGANLSLEVGAGRSVKVSGADELSIGGDHTLTTKGSQNISTTGAITISSNAKITLQVGSQTIELSPSGILISGAKIDIMGVGPVTINGAVVKVNS